MEKVKVELFREVRSVAFFHSLLESFEGFSAKYFKLKFHRIEMKFEVNKCHQIPAASYKAVSESYWRNLRI